MGAHEFEVGCWREFQLVDGQRPGPFTCGQSRHRQPELSRQQLGARNSNQPRRSSGQFRQQLIYLEQPFLDCSSTWRGWPHHNNCFARESLMVRHRQCLPGHPVHNAGVEYANCEFSGANCQQDDGPWSQRVCQRPNFS